MTMRQGKNILRKKKKWRAVKTQFKERESSKKV
jgi:hypothetical protein